MRVRVCTQLGNHWAWWATSVPDGATTCLPAQPQQLKGQPQHQAGQPHSHMGQPQHPVGQCLHPWGNHGTKWGNLSELLGNLSTHWQHHHPMGQPQHPVGQPQDWVEQPQHPSRHLECLEGQPKNPWWGNLGTPRASSELGGATPESREVQQQPNPHGGNPELGGGPEATPEVNKMLMRCKGDTVNTWTETEKEIWGGREHPKVGEGVRGYHLRPERDTGWEGKEGG